MEGTSMKKMKKVQIITGMALIASLLTACDPPMPPEMLAQLAEQSYTCIDGNVNVATDVSNSAVVDTLSESLAAACVDPLPAMNITNTGDLTNADIQISASSTSTCKAFASVPYGFDAGDVAYNVEGTDSLNLGYKTLAAVLNGQITNWSDPAIAKDNPDLTLPDLEIVVRAEAESNSLGALVTALGFQGAKLDPTKFTEINLFDGTAPAQLTSGEIAILPNSVVVANGLTVIGLNSGKKDAETGEKLFALPSEESLYAAGTQLIAKTSGSTLTMVIDPKAEAKPMFEGEKAAIPYQAIFPLTMTLCGEDNLLKRAAAAFMLRLDSQGALGYLNVSQLPEGIRYSAVGLVRKGLPIPKVTKKSE
jgi:hypothetical protein